MASQNVRRSSRQSAQSLLEQERKAIETAIRNGDESGYRMEHFGEKGRGVVTCHPLTRGQFVLEYAGELIGTEEAAKRETVYEANSSGCFVYHFIHNEKRLCIDATAESGRLGRLINHSRKGNLVPKVVEVDGEPHIVFLATRDLKANDELLYNYGDTRAVAIESNPWLLLS